MTDLPVVYADPDWGPEWGWTAKTEKVCQYDSTHGSYMAWLMKHRHPKNQPFWTNCPRCNSQWEFEAASRDTDIKGGLSERERRQAAQTEAANIPKRFANATVWNWQHGMDRQRRIWNWVRDYLTTFDLALSTGRCASFVGATGCGKTHLSIGMLRHVMEKGGTGYYTTVIDMLARIKATFHKDAEETEPSVMRHLLGVDLLVMDEAGRQLDTGYEIAQFFRVLSKRHSDNKPTVVVTNLNRESYSKFLGPEVLDRMMEGGGAVLMFDWGSQRSHKKPVDED